jgi:transcription elongation factor GreA
VGRASAERKEFEVSAFPAASDRELLVTPKGYARLVDDLRALTTVRRPELAEHFRQARLDADQDSPLLFDLLEEQAQLEARISLLEGQLAAARIVEPTSDGSAAIGSRVRVRHGSGEIAEYELVGPVESDAGNGRVSIEAPVGRALLGARAGDTVLIETPRRTEQAEILSVGAAARPRERSAA